MAIDENKATFDTVEYAEYNNIAETTNDITTNGLPQKLFFSGTDHGGIVAISLTTTERDLLTPENGNLIYNTTTNTFQFYENSTWRTFATGSGASQLNELSDVNTSTPTNRNVLVADGVDWESRALIALDVSDFDTEVSNNTDVTSNTSARHTQGTDTTLGTMTGDIDLGDNDLLNIKSAEFTVNAIGNSGATKTINLVDGGVQTITLDQNTTLTINPGTDASRVSLIISGGASYTVTWSGVDTWLTSGASAPTLAGDDVITFLHDGTNTLATHSNTQ